VRCRRCCNGGDKASSEESTIAMQLSFFAPFSDIQSMNVHASGTSELSSLKLRPTAGDICGDEKERR
jgi:hypothetical protein